MSYNSMFANFVTIFVGFLLCLAFLPSPLLPDLQPEAFTTKSVKLEGPLTINNNLDSAELKYKNKLLNGECVEEWEGNLYTGVSDGRIVRLANDKVETVFRSGGVNCHKREEGCGRPAGIRFTVDGELVVADLVKGLYKVNVKNGKMSALLSSVNDIVDGKPLKVPNHVDVSRSGDVYFSQVSTKWDFTQFHFEIFEASANGRILHYDPTTKTTKTLVDNLYFPNGVQLSPDEDYLLIAQTTKYNILKYHLKGPKKGRLETLVDNLPGSPDNIHVTPRGTFWIPLIIVRLPESDNAIETLGPNPFLRKILGRLFHVVDGSLKWIISLLPGKYSNELFESYQKFTINNFYGSSYGFIVEIDSNGKVIRSLQSPTGHVRHISHVLEHQGFLYLGSPFHPIATYKLKA